MTAGDPNLAATEELALACVRGGADILELGVPFSDPIADGPEIQMAGQRALLAGTRPRDVLDLAARLRARTEVPLVLMSYLNPILALGPHEFVARARAAGLDGLIIPDMPLEESDEIRTLLDAQGIDLVQLVSPATTLARAATIGQASRGFLYVVSRYGTTGTRLDLPEGLAVRLGELRRITALPLAVGFGISTKEHVEILASAGADGIVVGSAVVRLIAERADAETIEGFVADLASGLHSRPVTSPAPQGSSP